MIWQNINQLSLSHVEDIQTQKKTFISFPKYATEDFETAKVLDQ